MSWKVFLYDWGGLNIALFQAINMSTPAALEPLASFFNLVIGNYWTAPLMLLAMWGWSKSAPDPTRADAIRYRLRVFSVAFALAFLVATILKLWIDFPRPPAVFGDMVRVIGGIERHYSLPSGHATYAALVVGALWPSWPHRLGVVRRIGRLVTHRSRNALSCRCAGGVGTWIELHGARRVADAAGRPCVAIGSPHIDLGLVRSGRQFCHDRSARKVRHHPHVCLR